MNAVGSSDYIICIDTNLITSLSIAYSESSFPTISLHLLFKFKRIFAIWPLSSYYDIKMDVTPFRHSYIFYTVAIIRRGE